MSFTIDNTEEFNAFMGKIEIREAAFNAVWDGIIEETDRTEIQRYLSVTLSWFDNSEAFYDALISELYTGAIRSRKEGEPQPTRDLRWLPFVPYQY